MAESEGTSESGMRAARYKGDPVITPEQARQFLKDLGYDPNELLSVNNDFGSHDLRALIHIAGGHEPRKMDEVMRELFPDEQHGPIPKVQEEFLNPPSDPIRDFKKHTDKFTLPNKPSKDFPK